MSKLTGEELANFYAAAIEDMYHAVSKPLPKTFRVRYNDEVKSFRSLSKACTYLATLPGKWEVLDGNWWSITNPVHMMAWTSTK